MTCQVSQGSDFSGASFGLMGSARLGEGRPRRVLFCRVSFRMLYWGISDMVLGCSSLHDRSKEALCGLRDMNLS
jgi:hypothetical protein